MSQTEVRQWLDDQYRTLGYRLGYSFLYCPTDALNDAEILTVGLNPGGDFAGELDWDQHNKNSYLDQDWSNGKVGGTGIQRQIKLMLEFLGRPHAEGVCSFQYVPFRSPDWGSLARKDEALAIGDTLWQWLIKRTQAKLVISIGKSVTPQRIAGLEGGHHVKSVPIGWGNQKAEVYELSGARQMIALPHLSRFQIFGREASKPAIKELFKKHQK